MGGFEGYSEGFFVAVYLGGDVSGAEEEEFTVEGTNGKVVGAFTHSLPFFVPFYMWCVRGSPLSRVVAAGWVFDFEDFCSVCLLSCFLSLVLRTREGVPYPRSPSICVQYG